VSSDIPDPSGKLAEDQWEEREGTSTDLQSVDVKRIWENDEAGVVVELIKTDNLWKAQLKTRNKSGIYDKPVSRDAVEVEEAMGLAEEFAENWEQYDYR
jgi:hypothetical protein